MVTFTVLIPAYQAARTVGASVSSAIDQTHPAQVIVCDDGSTDGTADVLRSFGSAITVVTKANGGLSTARNAALADASGTYVVLLDADDTMAPDRLKKIAAHLLASDDDIVTTDARLVSEDGVFLGEFYGDRPFPAGTDQRAAILASNFIFVSSAVRTSRLREVGGFDERSPTQGEYEAWVRLILRGARVGVVREPLCDYMVRDSSLSSDPTYNRRHQMYALQRTLTEDAHLLARHELAAARGRLRLLVALDVKASAVVALRVGAPGARVAALKAARVSPSAWPSRGKLLAMAAAPRWLARRL